MCYLTLCAICNSFNDMYECDDPETYGAPGVEELGALGLTCEECGYEKPPPDDVAIAAARTSITGARSGNGNGNTATNGRSASGTTTSGMTSSSSPTETQTTASQQTLDIGSQTAPSSSQNPFFAEDTEGADSASSSESEFESDAQLSDLPLDLLAILSGLPAGAVGAVEPQDELELYRYLTSDIDLDEDHQSSTTAPARPSTDFDPRAEDFVPSGQRANGTSASNEHSGR